MANASFRKIKIYLFLFLLLETLFSFGQSRQKVTSFSEDFTTYIIELENFMNSSDNKDLKFNFRAFKEVTASSSLFTTEAKSRIIQISNLMLSKRLKPKPHFNQFLQGVTVLASNISSDRSVIPWLDVVHQLIENSSTKKNLLFLKFSVGFIQSNALRKSKSVSWISDSDSYSFSAEFDVPCVSFSKPFNLTCLSESGSMRIQNTTGRYFPLTNKWEGSGGKIDWHNTGFSEDSVYADLSTYMIDSRLKKVSADSVLFYNRYLFENPIKGQLINKIAIGRSADTYPRFTSYSKDIELKNIFPNVNYKGGYKLLGREFVADGGKYAEARIIFSRDDKVIFVASSDRFNLDENKISAQNAAVKIFFDMDSMYHSNVQFKYLNSSRKLQLYRDSKGISGSPMLSTYHQLSLDFEILQWNIDQDVINFGSLPGTAISVVNFESADLYLEERFDKLYGIDKVHPLLLVKQYIDDKKADRFYVSDFASYIGYPLVQVKHYLMNLANHGFIIYNSSDETVQVNNILERYVLAKSKKSDYDVIRFNSKVESPISSNISTNAALNIKNKDLVIAGVPLITLSDVQEVYLKPYHGRIIVKKNRDFIFSGQISAGSGRFNLFGQKFHFHYDDFKIDLNEIDSVQLHVPVNPVREDMYGNEILSRVKTVIEAVTGDLRIDHPTNKSGLKKDSFPEFPIFRSFEDSYAYYDRKDIQNGIYKRDNFSFHLQPFEIDSLENYTGKGLVFPGTFESAGIFPTFKDTLRLQEDYSLGFNRITPSSGFDIYSGKGKYYNNIHLSHEGLKGRGEFSYLNATARANEIFFFPDSTNLYTDSIVILEISNGIEFPAVMNTETYTHFIPSKDRLEIYKIKEQFNFYNNQARFDGDLVMQPVGLTGNGVMYLDKSELSSNLFSYNANWFSADTTNLKVFDPVGGLAFKANNLRSHIDVKERLGLFHSNGFGSFVELPANKYICYIDKLTWLMDDEKLMLGDELMSNSLGTEFVSVDSKQDSLSFIAKTADYSLNDYVIYAAGVDEIVVADATIYPDSGILTVERGGEIETLEGAVVRADNLTEYHVFNDATVNILGLYKYTASGNYVYSDASGNPQDILFTDIRVNEDTVTIGSGKVGVDDLFKINTNFDFKGNINLFADRADLIFDGYFRVNHSCKLLDKEWVKFNSSVNPDTILFELDEVVYNDKNEILSTGLIFSVDSLDIYSTFLSKKDRKIDPNISASSYSLFYDQDNSKYIVGGSDSISNYFILYDKICKTRSDGIIDFNIDLGRIDVKSVGFTYHDLKQNKKDFSGFLLLDFYFSSEAMEIMAEDIYSAPGEEIYSYGDNYAKSLARIVGQEAANVLMVDLEMQDEFVKFPKLMNHTLAFTDINFIWDNTEKAYVSKGEIGLGNIYDKQLNTILDGYILLERGKSKDEMTIYLQTEFYDVYYFNYRNGVMSAYSTNDEFNLAISGLSDSKRKANQERGKKPYRFKLATEQVVEKFYKRMQKIH